MHAHIYLENLGHLLMLFGVFALYFFVLIVHVVVQRLILEQEHDRHQLKLYTI